MKPARTQATVVKKPKTFWIRVKEECILGGLGRAKCGRGLGVGWGFEGWRWMWFLGKGGGDVCMVCWRTRCGVVGGG